MKKCPKCKAEIQENARFCLYCMTSFEEKQPIESPKESNKRWPYILAAVLGLVLIVLSAILFVPKNNQSANQNDISQNSSVISDIITSNNATSSEQQINVSIGEKISSQSNNQTQNTSKNENGTTNNTTANHNLQNTTTANNTTKTSVSSSNKTENNKVTNSTTTSTKTTTVTYAYRDAKYGDDFSIGANLENSVVITGVKTVSSNGEYKIPNTIDGKKVVAIMGLAFSDKSISNTVKKVVVPSTVKTIWNNAFANCYNMTDIYFCGNSIYTESNAFAESANRNGRLTIHCSASCSDRNFRYYKNSSSNYDAEYQEWNG